MSRPRLYTDEERAIRAKARYAAQYEKNKERRKIQMREYNLRTVEQQKVKRQLRNNPVVA